MKRQNHREFMRGQRIKCREWRKRMGAKRPRAYQYIKALNMTITWQYRANLKRFAASLHMPVDTLQKMIRETRI